MAVTGALVGFAAGAAGVISAGLSSIVIGALAGAAVGAIYDYVIESAIEGAIKDTMRDRMVSSREPLGSRKVIYGKSRVGGTIVYLASTGDTNEYLHQITVFAGHRITSFRDIYYDDIKAASYIGTGSATSTNRRYYNRYSNNEDGSESNIGVYTFFSCRNGSDDQTAYDTSSETDVAKRLPSQWSSNHKLSGIAHLYTRFDATDDNPYTQLPNVSAVIEGKPIYDPRQDSTSSIYDDSLTFSSCRADDEGTWLYSNNPALVALDFLTDTEYGAGIPHSKIDYDSLLASINACNTQITLADDTVVNQFECNGMIDMESSVRNNLAAILSTMNGRVTFSGGMFHIDAYYYKTPHSTILDEDMLLGSLVIRTKMGKKDLYNTVKGTFMSEEDNYTSSQFPTQTSSAYVEADGEKLEHDMALSMTTSHNHAQILSQLTLLKSRMQVTLKADLNIDGLQYRVGDNIKVANETFGYSQQDPKIFEITRLSIKPDATNGIVVGIEARETAEEIYDYDSDTALTYTTGTPVQLYDPYAITPVTSMIYFPTYHKIRSDFAGDQPAVGATLTWDGATGNDIARYEVVIREADTDLHVLSANRGKHTYIELLDLKPDTEYVATIDVFNSNSVRGTPIFSQNFTTGNVALLGTGKEFRFISTDLEPPSDTNFLNYFGTRANQGDQVVVLQVDDNDIIVDSATYVYRPTLSITRQAIQDWSDAAPESYMTYYSSGKDAVFKINIETQVINEDVTWTIESTSGFTSSDSGVTSFSSAVLTELEDSDVANVAQLVVTIDRDIVLARGKGGLGGEANSYWEIGSLTIRASWDNQYVEQVIPVGAVIFAIS